MKTILLSVSIFVLCAARAQDASVTGRLTMNKKPVAFVSIVLNKNHGVITDSTGHYHIQYLKPGRYQLTASFTGAKEYLKTIVLTSGQELQQNITLEEMAGILNDVIVTGVATASTIKNTPIAIATVSKKEMQYRTNTNIIDALVKAIPGVTAVTTGPNISKPFIRGLGYNRVLTMYDGVRQEGQQWGDEHGIEADQYGIARVEVIKGPASLSYGSDAVAGAINLIPTYPAGKDSQLHGDAQAEYHSNNQLWGSSIGISQKANSFLWAARGSAKAATNYTNAADGRVYGTGFKEIIFSAMAGIEKQNYRSYFSANAYDNLQEIPDGSRDSLTRQFTYQVQETDKDDIKQRPVVPGNRLISYKTAPLHQHIQHYRIYNKTTIKTKGGELNTLLGFQQNTRREFNHPTQPAQAGLYVTLSTINYDVKYSVTGWKDIQFTTGINGMYQSNTHQDATDFPIPAYRLFDAGTYLLVKKEINRFSVSGGIRYDHRNVQWNNLYTTLNPDNGFQKQATGSDTTGALVKFSASSQFFKGISASLGFTYVFSERLYMKANIARGYRAPNITETGANGLDPGAHIYYIGNKSFVPESNWQEDIGIFYNDKTITAGLEAFHNHVSHYIFLQKLLDETGQPLEIIEGNSTYQYTQASAMLYGLEASVSLQPQAYQWLTFKNSLAVITGLNKDEVLQNKFGQSAKYLPLIPPFHTLSTLHLELPVSSKTFSEIYVRTELEHYSAQHNYYAVDHTETATPGYNLVTVGSGCSLKNKSGNHICRLLLNVNNLLNTSYQSHLNRLKYFEYYRQSPNGRTGIYNMGRNISCKILIDF